MFKVRFYFASMPYRTCIITWVKLYLMKAPEQQQSDHSAILLTCMRSQRIEQFGKHAALELLHGEKNVYSIGSHSDIRLNISLEVIIARKARVSRFEGR